MAKGSRKQKETTASTPAADALPLFFKTPSVLDATRHAHATITPVTDYGFARAVNSLPLNTLEFIEAAKHYPIVFAGSADAMTPTAIVGFEQTNVFVDADGNWAQGAYIPAYVRQYPFIFFEQKSEDRFYLCVDESAPQFSLDKLGESNAYALFNADGTPSELSNHALQFCTSFYQHHAITKNFCADLVKHELLKPYQSEATLVSGKTVNLGGFQMIDENAFNALPDAVILEFREKGWLAFVYLALASASNWRRLADLVA